MLSPEAPHSNESLARLAYEMDEYLGESALTLFESLAKPSTETQMAKGDFTGNVPETHFSKDTKSLDPDDIEGDPES